MADITLSSGYILRLLASLSSQSQVNNTSTFSYGLYVIKTSGSGKWASGTWYTSARSPYANVIGTNSGSGYDFRNYSQLLVQSGTVTYSHNADGTFTNRELAGVFQDIAGNGELGSGTVYMTVTAPRIARQTTPNIQGGGGFTTGTESQINLPRAVATYTHDVSWSIGTKTGVIGTDVGTSVNWTPPHDVMTELPNAASGPVTITVVTKNGATVIGTTNTAFTLTAGATVVPVVSGVEWTDQNNTVKNNIGAFVQTLSVVKGQVVAGGVYGSTITNRQLIVGGTRLPDGSLVQLATPGLYPASGEATDSRGRTASTDASINVLPYNVPQLGSSGWQVQRANVSNVPDTNGQYLRIDLHAIAASLKVSTIEKNALRVSVRTRPRDGAWVQRNVINPGLTHNGAFQVSGGAAFLGTNSYDVEISLSDNTGTAPVVLITTVGTTVVTLDLRDNRVGVGKMHENGTLDVGGDIYSNNVRVARTDELPVAATETIAGLVARASQAEVNTGTDLVKYVSPNTLNGWGDIGSNVGMQRVIPTSIAISGGGAAVDSEGTIEITTSGVKALSLNGVFKAGGSYKVAYLLLTSGAENIAYRMRKGSVDFSTASTYVMQGIYVSGGWPGSIAGVSGYGVVGSSGLLSVNGQVMAYGELEIHISKGGTAYITMQGVSRSGQTSTQWRHTCDVGSGADTDGITFSVNSPVMNTGSFVKVWEMV